MHCRCTRSCSASRPWKWKRRPRERWVARRASEDVMALATTLPVSEWWVVRAGSKRFRVAADQVVEVIAWPRLTPVPRAADVLGTSAADAGDKRGSVVILKARVARQSVELGIVIEEIVPGDESSAEAL